MENDTTIYDNEKKNRNQELDPEATELVSDNGAGACPPPLPDNMAEETADDETCPGNESYRTDYTDDGEPQDEDFTTEEEEGVAAAGEEKKSGIWKNVVIGGVSGIMLGAGATVLTSAISAEDGEEPVENPEEKPEESNPNQHPLTDGEVPLAHNVNDSMSFGQAFAAARAEVGPGGVFEWHGQLYGTYYADEWNNMSAAERAEYNSHFSWAGSHTGSNGGGSSQTTHHNDHHGDNGGGDHGPEHVKPQPDGPGHDIKTVNVDGHEIKVNMVAHNSDGTNHASVEIDGHPAILTDLNGDGVFDGMIMDTNGDNVINGNEVAEVPFKVSVDDLGGAQDSEVNCVQMGQSLGFRFDVEHNGPEPEKPVAEDGLEIIHDNSTGQNWAYISVDGETRILGDLDGDGTFDGMLNDRNGDRVIDIDEVIDIRSEGFTVESLGGVTTTVDSFSPSTLMARAGWQAAPEEDVNGVAAGESNLVAEADVTTEGARTINAEDQTDESETDVTAEDKTLVAEVSEENIPQEKPLQPETIAEAEAEPEGYTPEGLAEQSHIDTENQNMAEADFDADITDPMTDGMA